MVKCKPRRVAEIERMMNDFLISSNFTFGQKPVLSSYRGARHSRIEDSALGEHRHDIALVVQGDGDYTELARVSYFPRTESFRVRPSSPVCLNPEILDDLWIYLDENLGSSPQD
jgi:hypothetical protein